jgi:hypothetical protein
MVLETVKNINKFDLVELSENNMVQALINLDSNTNRVLNVVKAKYNLKDKSEAIKFVVSEFIEKEDEPELRPEFEKKLKKILKQKAVHVDDLAKEFGLSENV